jgi:copper chaperone NosL
MKLNRISTVLFFLLIVIISSCTNGIKEINYSKDECDYCKMQISDNRFAAEIITNQGTVYKFDSIECMIGFALTKNILNDKSVEFYVCDFLNPGHFIEAKNSYFARNENLPSPMGLDFQAFFSQGDRDMLVDENNISGEKLNWEDVVELVKEER